MKKVKGAPVVHDDDRDEKNQDGGSESEHEDTKSESDDESQSEDTENDHEKDKHEKNKHDKEQSTVMKKNPQPETGFVAQLKARSVCHISHSHSTFFLLINRFLSRDVTSQYSSSLVRLSAHRHSPISVRSRP